MSNEIVSLDVHSTPEASPEGKHTTSEGATAPGGEPATGAAPHTAPATLLYRHPVHRLVGGVCGGLADYLGIDPALVRILWVVLTLGSAGAGLLAYAALWLLLPVGTAQSGLQEPATLELNERNIGRTGMLLVLLGGLWLLANLGILPWLWSAFWRMVGLLFWPVLLIGAGLLLLNNQREWRARFHRARERMRARLQERRRGKTFDGADVRSGLRKARMWIPLKRSRTDRMVFGVCGAIGRKLGIDANLVRLLWVAFSIGSIGTGVLVYVLAGLLLPEEGEPVPSAPYRQEPQDVPIIDGSLGG